MVNTSRTIPGEIFNDLMVFSLKLARYSEEQGLEIVLLEAELDERWDDLISLLERDLYKNKEISLSRLETFYECGNKIYIHNPDSNGFYLRSVIFGELLCIAANCTAINLFDTNLVDITADYANEPHNMPKWTGDPTRYNNEAAAETLDYYLKKDYIPKKLRKLIRKTRKKLDLAIKL